MCGKGPATQLLELFQNNMVKKEARDGAPWQKAAHHVKALGPILVWQQLRAYRGIDVEYREILHNFHEVFEFPQIWLFDGTLGDSILDTDEWLYKDTVYKI